MKIINQKIKSLFLLSLLNSASAKGKKTTNHSKIASLGGINLNSLPQIAANLTERENNPHPTLFFAGFPISFKDQKQCMASFALVPTEANQICNQINFANHSVFITSLHCCEQAKYNCESFPVSLAGNNSKEIGKVGATGFTTLDTPLDDYALVEVFELEENINLIPYVVGSNFSIYPVTGLGSATLGSKVCAYGAISGYHCGSVVGIDLSLKITDDWGNTVNLTGLNKVDLGGEYGFDKGRSNDDWGGPVYIVNNIGNSTIAQALGHITSFDNSDPSHKLLYYTPLDKILEMLPTSLNGDCYYTLMTYNETNTKEFQAQIEIPPKK